MAATWRVAKDMVFQGKFKAKAADMTGKTVVITGPSQGGIRFETALALAGMGAQVLLAARNVEKATADAEAIAAQVMSQAFRAPEHVQSRSSFRASSGGCPHQQCWGGEERRNSEDGVEITFATCVLGHHVLNFLLKPQRIVWVTGDIYAISDGSADPNFKGKGIPAYANACLARLMVAREMKRRGIVSEIIAVHPGVIRSQFIKPKNCCEGCFMNCCDCSRINVVAGAQSSIHAATCPSTDLREDTIYFHNKYGWYVLNPNDLAMKESRCQALFDECDKLCNISR